MASGISIAGIVILLACAVALLLLALVVGGVIYALIAKKSNRDLGPNAAHSEAVPCQQCGFVAQPAKT